MLLFCGMFNSPDYPQALEESQFEIWMENGRSSKIQYAYVAIIWDELERKYFPAYLEKREDLDSYERFGTSYSKESLVAAYDLYSESRVR